MTARISKQTGWPIDSWQHKSNMETRKRFAAHDRAVEAWAKDLPKKKRKRKKATTKQLRALSAGRAKRKANLRKKKKRRITLRSPR